MAEVEPTGSDAVSVALERSDTGDRTRTGKRSHAIDAMRALAALLVLVSHARALAGSQADVPVSRAMAAGVQLFFVVSGYLIAGPFIEALLGVRRMPWLPGYAVRRVARIWPAYIVAFFGLLVIVPRHGIQLWQYPVHLFLLQSWVPGQSEAIFAVAWTLGLEAMFYAVVPLAALAVRRRRSIVTADRLAVMLLAVYAVSTAWYLLVSAATPAIGSHQFAPEWARWTRGLIFVHLSPFVPGALIALAQSPAAAGSVTRRVFDAIVGRPLVCLGIMSAFGFIAVRARFSPTVLWNDAVSPLAWIALYSVLFALVVSDRLRLPRVWAVLAPVGVVSYGIYLWHWILRLYIARNPEWSLHGARFAWGIDSVLLLAYTLPFAIGSWMLIERVAMRRAADWARTELARREKRAPVTV